MLIYAGIDEAGYGPVVGPLVIASSLFVLDSGLSSLPDLWESLEGVVCRTTSQAKNTLVAVNDSKLLYNPALGIKMLERGVLSFLPLLPEPLTLPALLSALEEIHRAHLPAGSSNTPVLPWYKQPPPSGLPAELPAVVPAEDVRVFRELVRAGLERIGVRAHYLCASVVYEDRFNLIMEETDNKSLVPWRYLSGHLKAIWERFGTETPQVIVDRQSGRKDYGEQLVELFPGARVTPVFEQSRESVYEVEKSGRAMRVSFLVEADAVHLPTALAAMTAKYVRELLMRRLQGYWAAIAPQVKPTAGYFADGRRFLAEIEPHSAALGITIDMLSRRR